MGAKNVASTENARFFESVRLLFRGSNGKIERSSLLIDKSCSCFALLAHSSSTVSNDNGSNSSSTLIKYSGGELRALW
ncbi:hypothetical protein TYRP_011694 [Tyrophagus putrescentiae]|nr:hypothetical protein TYRP_011694 [Tyrophagus putrescentiae]